MDDGRRDHNEEINVIPKPLEKIDAADILALVTNGDEERRTMDFKRDLPGNADKDKNELRADVTSFANSGGGDLIFGVDEAGGVATGVPGLPGVDPNAEILRIEAIIQASIDPRVPGLESRAVPIPGKGSVIVVRVPQSWRGPHLVKINDTFRMFGRNSKGKYIFDATEIRSAFALSVDLPERIRRWRDDRLAKLMSGQAAVPLQDGAQLCIHILPLQSFTQNVELAVGELKKKNVALRPPAASAWDHRVNLDGFVTFERSSASPSRNLAYCQVFRSGRVEAVNADIVSMEGGRLCVAGGWFEPMIVEALKSYLNTLQGLVVPLPLVVMLSVVGAKGAWLLVPGKYFSSGGGQMDRDVVMLPEVMIETYDQDIPKTMRAAFDAFWNAFGWERSYNYSEKGEWSPR